VVLGVLTWRKPAEDLETVRARPTLFGNALVIAVINPKTLMFNAAFLPQFVPADAAFRDLAAAGLVMLGVIFAGDLCWALFASRAGALLRRYAVVRNRITGAFLVAAGLSLAIARR
jgi:threonine/homoserine/homoserine lactone efflux protein